MDLQKEMQICSKEFEEKWDVFCEAHGSRHNKSVAKYFFFASWQQAKAWVVPEGFVLVPKEPNKQFKNVLSRYLDELWMGDHGCDWDYFVDAKAIKPNEIWQFMIKAQELTND
ncbi:hypothetical protein [Acinetobacter indicus]|uniref:hypothetical protein n=1 Tax=Acinetobacter indicus TaxID=756892 RepID=UPI0025789BFF|nr:hypothetical protein [Acinetobacter indicus]MDM1272646.1 hypothetical protein [Acinetobacter indicus]